jgi:glucokinase
MAYFLGVDLGGTTVKMGIASESGEIKDIMEIPTLADSNHASIIIENMKQAVIDLITKNKVLDIRAMGIGVPGCALSEQGVITSLPNIPVFQDYPLVKELNKDLKIPIYLDNDANNAARGEFVFGSGKGRKNFVFITLGTGVGGGVFINGDLYGGEANYAGEIGHTVMVPDGRLCGCGNYGCWEAYSSASAMSRRAKLLIEKGLDTILKKHYPDKLNAKAIMDAAKEGDAAALFVFEEAARFTGIGVANLLNIFNPSACIIGGGVSHAGKFLLDRVRFYAQLYALPKAFEKAEILLAKLGNQAGILGGAALAFMKFKNERDSL